MTANRRLRRETEAFAGSNVFAPLSPSTPFFVDLLRSSCEAHRGRRRGGFFVATTNVERARCALDGIMESNNASDVDRTRIGRHRRRRLRRQRLPRALTLYFRFDRQAARKTNQRRVVTDRACNST